MSNEQRRLYADGTVYETGPTFEPEDSAHGTLVEKLKTHTIPSFLDKLRNDQRINVLFVHPSLLGPNSKDEMAGTRGRRTILAKWMSKDDGAEYTLKNDFTVGGADGYKVIEHLAKSTNISQFVRHLKEQGDTIIFVHKKFLNGKE